MFDSQKFLYQLERTFPKVLSVVTPFITAPTLIFYIHVMNFLKHLWK